MEFLTRTEHDRLDHSGLIPASESPVDIPVPVSQGGTGATTPEQARINLEIPEGLDPDAFDPAGSAAAAQSASQPRSTNLTLLSAVESTPVGRALLAAATEAAARTILELGTAALADTGDFDPAGAAATAESNAEAYTDAAITTHEGASDPHPGYLTQAEADLLYDILGAAATAESNANSYTDAAIAGLPAPAAVPTGTPIPWAGIDADPPSGFLFADIDNQNVSRTTYSDLFDVLVKRDTVTIDIASPCVIHWTGHNLAIGTPIRFSTTGALPTGLNTVSHYYVISAGYGTDQFEITDDIFAGTPVVTTGSQSGVHTAEAAPWGHGDGSTTFGVPNFRQKMMMGYSPETSLAPHVGYTGGSVTHTHGVGSFAMPNHSHAAGTLAGPSHNHGTGGVTVNSHTHSDGTLVAIDHVHAAGGYVIPNHTHTSASHSHPLSQNGWSKITAISGTGIAIRRAAVTNWTDTHLHTATGQAVTGESVTRSSAAELGGDTDSTTPGVTGATPSATSVAGNSGGALGGDVDVTGATGAATPGVSGNTDNGGTGAVTGSTASDGGAAITGTSAATSNIPLYTGVRIIIKT